MWVTSSRRIVISGSREIASVTLAANVTRSTAKRMAGGDSALAGDLQQQRSSPPHFFLQQPGRGVLAVGFQRVGADQFRKVRSLMRRRRANGTHFPEFDGDAATRALPRRFRAREACADHAY